jgi:hypothetical protein
MDPTFLLQLRQVREQCASVDVPEHYVGFLNETIESLEQMKKDFLERKPAIDVLKARLLEINKELEAMGVRNYSSLPDGYIASDDYYDRVAKYENEIAEMERMIQTPSLLSAKRWSIERASEALDQAKCTFMYFLEHQKHLDAVTYRIKSRQLLDEKLALLRLLRKKP